jgi:pimeloyl-ACP methyl ester carboxylesterase
MPSAPLRTLHYIRSWLTGRDDLVAGELVLDRDGTEVPATLLLPRARARPLPAWVVLHGITRPGREHAQLVRFTRALASAGSAVLVPEVPEWRALDLAPGLTLPTVVASVRALERHERIDGRRIGLVGFSFGSPQALAASAHPDVRGRLAGVVGFGGYCDLERTILFQLTGEHEWGGRTYHLRPDPYGRWIVAANYLTAVPGMEDALAVAGGLRRLAAMAGDLGVMSWDEQLEPLKEEIRARLGPGRHREVFDLLAPAIEHERGRATSAEIRSIGHELAAAARRVDPAVEPGPLLAETPGPVHLLHGLRDHLIPFTEMYRLAGMLPTAAECRATVTPLFGHSSRDPFPGLWDGARESVRFGRALSRLLGVV